MKKTLGIIGAEQQEIDLLLERLLLEKTVKKAGLSFFCGTIDSYPVVIVKAGIGKVNAAACTQMLIDLFDVKMIVNTGAAGSLDSRINIGDIVVSTEVIQHDLDVTDLAISQVMFQVLERYLPLTNCSMIWLFPAAMRQIQMLQSMRA